MKKILTITAAILLCGAAQAANFDAKITNLDGTPILDEKGKPTELTVRTICINALMQPLKPEDQNKPDSGVEKTRRAELARRVLEPNGYLFSAEDVVLLKKLVNEMYASPLVVSQAWRALEEK